MSFTGICPYSQYFVLFCTSVSDPLLNYGGPDSLVRILTGQSIFLCYVFFFFKLLAYNTVAELCLGGGVALAEKPYLDLAKLADREREVLKF